MRIFRKLFTRKNEQQPTLIDQEHLEEMRLSLKTKVLPIVVLDNSWHKIKNIVADREFFDLENKVMDLLKKRGQLTYDIEKATKTKNKLLSQILEISDRLNNTALANNALLEQEITLSRETLLQMNDYLDMFAIESAVVEEDLVTYNLLLVENTVVKSYTIMMEYREKISELDKEIDQYRNLLLLKNSEKKQYETAQQELYNYLHQIVGRSSIEKLDKIVSVEKE
ncbi:hypothetical protein [Candidatus Epulonipiscium viviparus]|uniref:hypothetical protein n=1 Tax=Candidatus Epulonipiscium viviparus TaxID=420336 RepID=UPI0027380B7A|nr:hypothetical protein [Candidatus Epulopiscium viviparus]